MASHFRKGGRKHHRTANHLERVLALCDQHRRGIPAHALQRGQELGNLAVTLIERAAKKLLLLLQAAQPIFHRGELGFARLYEGRCFHEPHVEALAFGLEAGHVRFERSCALLRALKLDAATLEVFLCFLARGRRLGNRAAAEREHGDKHQASDYACDMGQRSRFETCRIQCRASPKAWNGSVSAGKVILWETSRHQR